VRIEPVIHVSLASRGEPRVPKDSFQRAEPRAECRW
jgi:hypothetical protein